jgi:hypothetical protein
LLIAVTLVWGGCISCEQYFMFSGAKGCCSPGGHCKTKQTPAKQDCKQIAFDHHKTIDHSVELPVTAIVLVEQPYALFRVSSRVPVDTSPPDLEILHSSFLI